MRENPCFMCSNRHQGCHGDCQNYIEWLKEHKEENKKIKINKWLENIGGPKKWK